MMFFDHNHIDEQNNKIALIVVKIFFSLILLFKNTFCLPPVSDTLLDMEEHIMETHRVYSRGIF